MSFDILVVSCHVEERKKKKKERRERTHKMATTFSWTALLFALSLILFQVTAHGDHEEEEDHEHHDTDMDDPGKFLLRNKTNDF